MGKRTGQCMKKVQLLGAWLKDGKFGQTWMNVCQTLKLTRTHTEKLTWLSLKEWFDKYGQKEGRERIQDGSAFMRKDPGNTKFYQFLGVEHMQAITVEQQKEMKATRVGKMTGEQWSAFEDVVTGKLDAKDAFQSLMEQDDMDLEGHDLGSLKSGGKKVLADEVDEEDDDDGQIPPDLRNMMGAFDGAAPKTKAAPKAKTKPNKPDDPGHNEEAFQVDAVSCVGRDDSQGMMLDKLDKMQSMLKDLLGKYKSAKAVLKLGLVDQALASEAANLVSECLGELKVESKKKGALESKSVKPLLIKSARAWKKLAKLVKQHAEKAPKE